VCVVGETVGGAAAARGSVSDATSVDGVSPGETFSAGNYNPLGGLRTADGTDRSGPLDDGQPSVRRRRHR
jgi:hypothetical protein